MGIERVDQETINALGNADIIMVFPRVMAKKSKTRLVLKKAQNGHEYKNGLDTQNARIDSP